MTSRYDQGMTPATTTRARITSVEGELIVQLPADASAALPSRGQVAVTGTINGAPLETVVEPDGRRGHWIKLSAARAAGPFAAGDEVALELVPAAEWPEPDLPEDLQAALDAAPDTDELWQAITPMARWEWARWVRATRNPATRAKRIDVTISKLRAGKRRPCCFDLASCTDPQLARSGKLIEQ